MNSDYYTTLVVGFPIRKSTDQRILASPRGLSQPITSFIASQCQGIHKMLLLRLICTQLIIITRPKISKIILDTLPWY